ncbi:MAG: bifunctional (p)ppGpp synthetase/guanosine-3',5'-bis(diphosphate) 3'-pyrophosphohydrolase [Prevotella sp.]|jgi:guanosine-3',5'-bis(diphosphate) 3'-pyrophosphohydrolase|nr:bifunctional (p)ppGpp synthetase/guanosine-3',5'-bis(diphosphate) 3'-pyrophosphohydrolase [Prevotella sp.]MBS7208684.1 bifunctional (p)ppGpp synthetase/guanosine-3',5'-bis(diphosphate) 3'-pyrophosphohydrolase [Prevotella sp.]
MEIKMMETYYTDKERKFVISAFRELRIALADDLSYPEIRRIEDIIKGGIAAGKAHRDKYGINPSVRHLNTALLLSRYVGADRNMIIATLLYQICSDDYFSLEDVKAEFGDDVRSIIHGLKNVADLYKKQTTQRDENFSKLMMAFAENIRVIIIMIVDRLALMKAINHHPNQKFVFDIASESLYLYAPLAHRLGLYKIKSELEDMSLKYTNRDLYTQIAHKLNESKQERDKYIAEFIAPIKKKLEDDGFKFEIKGRTKSIYSIWNKMRKQNAELKDIYDLFAIRIIIDTPLKNERSDCWKAFAIVTDMFKPNPSRLKDWISIPKSNGYESLHTTVTGPGQRWVEVQIRTQRMDEIAEKGLAAHFKYKGVKSEKSLDDWMANVRDLLETSGKDTPEIMKKMNMDVYDKEVFIFTPKGDLFRLPLGATILDFAFAIHSKIGCTCIGGKVNGKTHKINYELKNGDTVEVLTSSTQQPKQQWLSIVTTSKAKNKIRQSLNEISNRSAEFAKELLQRRFKNRKIEIEEAILTKVIKRLGYKTATDFYNEISSEKLDIGQIVDSYVALKEKEDETQQIASSRSAQEFVMQPPALSSSESSDVVIIGEGIKGINFKLSKCCMPIQGDDIMGFIASDGAIKIHKRGCPNARHLMNRYPYRTIKAAWSEIVGGNQFAVPLSIIGNDDIGIVNNITSLITKEKSVSLRSIAIDSNDGLFQGRLVVGVNDTVSLNNLIKKITAIKGVKDVRRNN